MRRFSPYLIITMYMCRLTYYEREQIESYRRRGYSYRRIGRYLRRDHSVIVREVNRNMGDRRHYAASTAQRNTERRMRAHARYKLDKDPQLYEWVVARLKEGWAPHTIAGRLKRDRTLGKHVSISHEGIYRYIQTGPGRWQNLWQHLACARPRRRSHRTRKHQSIPIKQRISIHQRSKEVDTRKVLGHWETDSMIFSKQKQILSVQVERASRLTRITRCMNKTAQETDRAIRTTIDSVPLHTFKTLTYDNGTEGALHYTLMKDYDIQTYFADPYCSWQKGGVERVNRQIRRYLPLKRNLSAVSDEEIQTIENRLNNTPRRSLNYATPNEIFSQGGAMGT